MSDPKASPGPGSGGHGREYPELPPDVRERAIALFNEGTREFFPGRLGFRVVDMREGYARLVADNAQEHSNGHGVMHGGASFGLADTAVAAALMPMYGGGNLLLTIEMKINYLEPIPPGEVIAEAYVLRSSRRSAYAEVDIWSQGKLAARASTTYMIKPMKG
jgi:acyl-CoA thioesterase